MKFNQTKYNEAIRLYESGRSLTNVVLSLKDDKEDYMKLYEDIVGGVYHKRQCMQKAGLLK